jgi:hypothetical protein
MSISLFKPKSDLRTPLDAFFKLSYVYSIRDVIEHAETWSYESFKVQLMLNAKEDTGVKRTLATEEGDDMLSRFERLLDSIEPPARPIQRKIFKEITNCCLQHFYGDRFETHKERILRLRNINDYTELSLIMTPRRQGKTVAISRVVAVMLIVIPGFKVTCFAVKHDRSKELVRMVKSLLLELGYPGKMLVNAERILIEVSPTDIRTLESYSSRGDVSLFFFFLGIR